MLEKLQVSKNAFFVLASFAVSGAFQSASVFAQESSIQSSVDAASKQEVIFLNDRPAPESVTVSGISRTKGKLPQRSFTVYGIDQGLPLQSAVAGYRDVEGYLWFATGAGVSKFDGSTFKTFDERHGLGNSRVSAITQDKAGNFYFGTRTGLSFYNGETITNYYVDEGFPAKPISSLVVDANNQVWCGTIGGGLVRFDGHTFKTFTVDDGLLSNTVRSLEFDNDGLLWIGTKDGITTFNGSEFGIFEMPRFRDKTIYDIHKDRRGNIWFAGEPGLLKYDGKDIQHFPLKEAVPDSRVFSIGEGGDGAMWFGTIDGGVIRFDGTSFEPITMADGLPSNRIWGIVTGVDDHVWFCTQAGGIARYNGNALVSFTTQQGLGHNLVWSITQDRHGTMWFAHDNGFSSYDGEFFQNVTSKDSLFHFFAIAADSKGVIWGGGRHGLIRWKDKRLTKYAVAQGLASNQISDIAIDKNDVLWVGTDQGVTRFDGQALTNFTVEREGNDQRIIRVFVDRKQNVWASTSRNIFVHSGSGFTPVTLDGLPKNFAVTAFVHDLHGNYWLASRAGLARYDGTSCLLFSSSEGLPNEQIFDLKLDSLTGDLWMGTNRGLTKLSFRNSDGTTLAAGRIELTNQQLKTLEPRWSEYNRRTGYPMDDLNHPALFITTETHASSATGRSLIWGGFGDKLFRFDPMLAQDQLRTVRVAIQSLKVGGRTIPWNSLKDPSLSNAAHLEGQERLVLGTFLTTESRERLRQELEGVAFDSVLKFSGLPRGLSLPHAHGTVTFIFGAIETSRSLLVNYQYRLRGQLEAWSYPSPEGAATFTQLWEGDYIFEVRAQNRDQGWSEPVQFTFKVKPPWWRSVPMYGAYTASIFFMLLVLVKIRERALQYEKRKLEAIVRQRTKELNVQKEEALSQKRLVEERNEEIRVQLEQTERDLSNQTLDIIQRQNLFREIEDEIERLVHDRSAGNFQKLASLVKVNKSLEKEWDTFNHYFSNVHRDFYTRLMTKAPSLSINEQRLAALVRMNLDNRQIATLLGIEVSSVKMAKYRLKKKFELEESDDLLLFLTAL